MTPKKINKSQTEPYQRAHKRVKGEVVGTKAPSTNLGLIEIRRKCNEFFRSRGMPERAFGEYYDNIKPN